MFPHFDPLGGPYYTMISWKSEEQHYHQRQESTSDFLKTTIQPPLAADTLVYISIVF